LGLLYIATNAGLFVNQGVVAQAISDNQPFGSSTSTLTLLGGTVSSSFGAPLSLAVPLVVSAASTCNAVGALDQLTFSTVNPGGQNMTITGGGTCLFNTLAASGTTFSSVNLYGGTFSIADGKLSPSNGVYAQSGTTIELFTGTYNFAVTAIPTK
jgi:hypothetical protein